MNKKSFLNKDKLLFSTALVTSFAGYYKRSYADCVGDNGTYVCSAEVLTSQSFTISGDASFTTAADFNLHPASGNALSITGNSAVLFTDVATSNIISADGIGFEIVKNSGGSNGEVTLNINGNIVGDISAISITHNSGTNGNINTTIMEGATVQANGTSGIGVIITNSGNGTTDLKVSGQIDGVYGVFAINSSSTTGLAITTYSGSAIAATSNQAIFIQNDSSTATSILDISGSVISASSNAIHLYSGAANITIQNGGYVKGDIAIYSYSTNDSVMNVTLDGSQQAVSVIGTGTAGAIVFAGTANDVINVTGDVTIDGDVDMGDGTDAITFNSTTLILTKTNTVFSSAGTISLTISGDNIINGNLDLSQFSTNPTINSGASLSVNGTLTPFAGTFTVDSNRTLGGNVTIDGNLTAGTGATIAPGNSIGDIVVDGTANFDGATLDIEVSNTDSDTITTTTASNGDIIVDNATLNIIPLSTSGSATILTAGGTGAISATNLTTNVVGGGIVTTAINGNSLSVIFANSSTLSASAQASVNSSILFSDTVSDEMANSTFIKDRHFWVRGIYRNQNQATEGSNFGFRNNNYGVALGSQFNVGNPSYKLGFALSTIHENLDIDANQGGKKGDSVFASVYGTYNGKLIGAKNNSFFTSLAFGFGYHSSENERAVSNLGVSSMASSSTNDMEVNSTLQTGFKFVVGQKENWYISPRLSASYIHTFADGFTEENGGDSGLKVNDYSFDTVKFREVLKFGANKYVNFAGLAIFPYAELGLAQERTIGNRKIRGEFLVNNTSFTTTLSKNNRNFLTGAVGGDIKITPDSAAFISYQRSEDFSNNEKRNDVNVGLRIRF